MRRTAFLLAGLSLVALTGCQSDVATQVDVTGANESNITSTITFSGEVAQEIRQSPALQAQVDDLFESRIGRSPAMRDKDGTLTYTTELSYAEMTDSQDVLGVGSAGLVPDGENVTFNASLVVPEGLREAILQTVAEEPDAAALADTLGGTTTVSLQVHFNGGIVSSSGPEGLELDVQGDTLRVVQDLNTYQSGDIQVVGDPTPALWERLVLPGGILLGVGALLLLVRWFRNRPASTGVRSLPQ